MKKNNSKSSGGFLDRRSFIKTGASLLTALAAPSVLAGGDKGIKVPDAMLIPGAFDDEYGKPSGYEKAVKRLVMPNGNAAFTPLDRQRGIITPPGLHFGAHHSGIPTINPEEHELYIHGLTEKALRFTLEDLARYPHEGGVMFLECSGNTWLQATSGEQAPDKSCAELYGLVSGSEWLGVPVRLLLEEAGIKPGGKWVIVEGSDAGTHARSIPIEKLLDDAIIALYQNGERLRPAQGYPMRLFLPGWEGNMNVKWVRRMEVVEAPAFTKDESRAYTETLPDGSIEQFSFYMGVKSVITTPSGQQKLPAKGFYELNGLAWSGFGKISYVEVSDDDGKTWHKAQIHGPVLTKSLTRFTLPWQWSGNIARLQSRAVDEFGNRQPSHQEWKSKYLDGSYNHYNAIQTWEVAKDGGISNVF
ncbi:sulfite dehydrogenase [Thalassomonas sp. RHCl1]|uniref:sulfite dehydrogenase n=1 Tax=Thalassomonas sp. RHCl1 TaxID=2995320 RepID=UPI00248CE01B|nr:sulfite dehydrogenase [Thalassomonas sp. RHCl1]